MVIKNQSELKHVKHRNLTSEYIDFVYTCCAFYSIVRIYCNKIIYKNCKCQFMYDKYYCLMVQV